MSVPFKDAAELDAGGTAAYLRLVPGQGDRRRGAALFQVNARGAPVEFTYNRLDLPDEALWRPEQLEREAAKALARSLFEAARRTPLVLICLADEIDAALLARDLEVQIPVCRVAVQAGGGPFDTTSVERVASGDATAHLFWRPALPSVESPPRRLVTTLAARGLLLEPFERAVAGFHEAFAGT
ncbi:MAG TPA: hypothetical protein VLW53_00355 [Candidatus Eisenbacteria bacterium]|nr:hypothetical protein [Candidatus Eisenbacteria bacterium]